jgi:chromosome segregation ATPase
MFSGKNEPQDEVKVAQASLSDLKSKMDEISGLCDKKETELAFLDGEIESKKKDLLDSMTRAEEGMAAEKTATALRLKAEGEAEKAGSDLASVLASIEDAKKDAEEVIAAKKEEIVSLNKVIAESQNYRDRQESVLKGLKVQVDDETARLSSVTADVASKTAELEKLEKELDNTENERIVLNNGVLSLKNELGSLQTEIAVETTAFEAQKKAQAEYLNAETEKFEEEKAAFEAYKAEAEKSLAEQNSSVAKRAAWNEDVRKKLVQYKSELEVYYKREFPDLII